jgi:hypothetical protein
MWLENKLKIMHKGKCQMQIVSYMGRIFNVHIGNVCDKEIECVHSDILRRIIVEQVARMMVLPNKLPIQLSDVIPATVLKTPKPEVCIHFC